MGTHEDEADLATGAQLYRMNELGLLPAKSQITKEEASEILSVARRNGTWPKERPRHVTELNALHTLAGVLLSPA